MTTSSTGAGPLSGLRVLELGHFVAAPFCTRLLGDLGADVIKVEPPGAGDPVRQWGARFKGESAWWSVHGRNKRCVTLNLKHPRARELALGLAARSDALVENFRPGQLDKLGLGEAALRAARPDLVIARISGYGQDGPQRDRAAFGVIAALWRRDATKGGDGRGRSLDVALTESILLEGALPEYAALGA